MDREKLKQRATSLCKQHRCNEVKARIHFHQMVDKRWNPHPPQSFITWWKSHPESNDHDAVRAYNCACYFFEFKEAVRQAELPNAQPILVPKMFNPQLPQVAQSH